MRWRRVLCVYWLYFLLCFWIHAALSLFAWIIFVRIVNIRYTHTTTSASYLMHMWHLNSTTVHSTVFRFDSCNCVYFYSVESSCLFFLSLSLSRFLSLSLFVQMLTDPRTQIKSYKCISIFTEFIRQNLSQSILYAPFNLVNMIFSLLLV